MQLIDSYNSAFENATRFAAFKQAIKAGNSPESAAQLAKNISINFNQTGSARGMNDLYLFWNASMQGTGRLVRNLGMKPKEIAGSDATRAWYQRFTRVHGTAAGLVGLGLTFDQLNRSISDVNPATGRLYYDDIPDFEKARNMIIMTGNAGEYYKIPLPYGVGYFYRAGIVTGKHQK